MKNIFCICAVFVIIVCIGCNHVDTAEYSELGTEFVGAYDAPDEKVDTFYGRWVDDYYLCSVTTIYLRSFERVTSVYAEYSDDDKKLVVHINTDLDSFPVELDRKARIEFKLYGIPRKVTMFAYIDSG